MVVPTAQEGDKAEKREEAAGQRAELSRLLEEYYALDHEGVAGGGWGLMRKVGVR